MEIAANILAQHFDSDLIEKIQILRLQRVKAAKIMLSDLDETKSQLLSRGIVDEQDMEHASLKTELEERVATLSARLDKPHAIFPDELALLIDMVD
jgi:hypothetical protein